MTKNSKKIMVAEDIQDPFSGSIDEFLMEKQSKSAQETAIDALEDETDKTYVEPEQQGLGENPQEMLEEKSEETQDTSEDAQLSSLEDQQKKLQEQIDKLKQDSMQENNIEARLKKIARDAAERGYPALSTLFLKAAGGASELLNRLLLKAYLILDILNNYHYLFEDETLYAKHIPIEFIRLLQKAIVATKGIPTINRMTIPDLNPTDAQSVLLLIAEYEKLLVVEILDTLQKLEDEQDLLVRAMLEKQVVALRDILGEGDAV